MVFDRYLIQWGLAPDGEPVTTNSSRLLPVRRGETPAMLKIAVMEEEQRSCSFGPRKIVEMDLSLCRTLGRMDS